MIDHPDMHNSAAPENPVKTQDKLILPAPPEQLSPTVYTNPRVPVQGVHSDPRMHIPPALLIRHQAPPPRSLTAKLAYFWRKDPAYKVLMIAVVMVILAGLLLTTFATSTFLHGFGGFASGPVTQNPPATQPPGTVDNKPTFPTPGGGDGSTATSQPPMQSTPVLQPTTPIQPTASPTSPTTGNLTLQIVSIPNHVHNNSGVDVGVNASQANISVSLVIFYSIFPYRAQAGPVTTDNNGNATLHWFVFVNGFNSRGAIATVYAVARDQNGQIVHSQPSQVQISTQGGGGM